MPTQFLLFLFRQYDVLHYKTKILPCETFSLLRFVIISIGINTIVLRYIPLFFIIQKFRRI